MTHQPMCKKWACGRKTLRFCVGFCIQGRTDLTWLVSLKTNGLVIFDLKIPLPDYIPNYRAPLSDHRKKNNSKCLSQTCSTLKVDRHSIKCSILLLFKMLHDKKNKHSLVQLQDVSTSITLDIPKNWTIFASFFKQSGWFVLTAGRGCVCFFNLNKA